MSALKTHTRFRPVELGCFLCAVVLAEMAWAADGDRTSQPTRAPRELIESSRSVPRTLRARNRNEHPEVKLSFSNAPWPRVLLKIAVETNSKLVMHEKPEGRFTRRDSNRYTRTEAIHILNRELEPKGFRLIEQGESLVVLNLHDFRTRYRRPIAPVRPENPGPLKPTSRRSFKPQKYKRRTYSIASRDRELRQASLKSRTNRRRSIRRASHVDEDQPTNRSEQTNPSEREKVTAVKTRHSRAADVARTIYRTFKSRAELIDWGPNGLPTFRVYRSQPSRTRNDLGKPRRRKPLRRPSAAVFTISIDTKRDELLVSAPPGQTRDLVWLIQQLDAAGGEPNTTIRLLPGAKNTRRIATRLQVQLTRLVAQRKREDAAAGEQPDRADDAADDRGERQPPKQTDPTEALGGLQGDVNVESLQDLGVLLLRGNKRDVDAVMRIIREIEKLTLLATPEVHLLRLRHVHSEALAPLLSSVYEGLRPAPVQGAQPRQSISFIPVVKPNAILILAPSEDLKSILELAVELDQPVDPLSEFQVIGLKSAVAAHVVSILIDFYQERAGLRTRVRAVADARTNSVIVQARPRDLAEVAALIRRIDRDESPAVSRMRIFPLKNAFADELAVVITTAIQSILNPSATSVGTGGIRGGAPGSGGRPITQRPGPRPGGQTPTPPGTPPRQAGGASTQGIGDAKSVILEFLAVDGEAQRFVRSGILFDIRVTADPRINSLVVIAPQQSMELMAELIRQLDQPTTTVADIKMFSLENADATATVQLLEKLFGVQDQQQQGGTQVAGAEDADSNLIPLQFSVDVRTNSVFAKGGSEALRVVEAILLRLDHSDIRQRQNDVIRLLNSPADRIAEAINQFMRSQRDLAQLNPDLISDMELLQREVIAVAEPISNSLLISATPRYFEEIRRLVAELDKAPAQVIIQALLVEVVLQNTDEFGIELGFQDSVLFDRGLLNLDNFLTTTETTSVPGTGISLTTEQIVNQELIPGFNFNNTQLPLGNNTFINPTDVGTQGLSNFSLGRLNGDLGFGGLVLSANSESISALLRALSARRTIHVLMRPQIRTLDNLPATIHVGQQVPVVNGVDVGQTITSPRIVQEQVGIVLTVIPRISPDGTIVIETDVQKSELSGNTVPIFFDAANNRTINSPIIDITDAVATVSVRDGQTIVLGGMITKSDSTLERKVPWLAEVPLLGRLFRYDSTTTRRTELLIFLTPRVIHNDADSELIKQVEAERMHFIEEDAEAMHGPLYAVPPEMQGIERQPAQPPQPLQGKRILPFPENEDVPTTVVPRDMLNVSPTPGAQAVRPVAHKTKRGESHGLHRGDSKANRPQKANRRQKKPRRPIWILESFLSNSNKTPKNTP